MAGLILRAVVLALSLACAGPALAAQPAAPATQQTLRPDATLPESLQPDTYRLWSGRAPNAGSDAPAETPTLTVFRPQFPPAKGPAVVIAPGGGYVGLAMRLEGIEPAAWFTSRGVTAFVLKYRVGATARLPAPLLDGARAIRFVRAHATEFGVDPNRIGLMGFSAGGHLAASIAVDAAPGRPEAADLVERVSSRPDFLILGYPWLQATQLGPDGHSQYCDFSIGTAGPPCNPRDFERFAPLARVSAATPPTFIYHTTDDGLVPVGGSAKFFEALVAHGVPAELHAFETGAHGTGLGGQSPALSHWPELLDAWLRARGVLAPQSTPPAH